MKHTLRRRSYIGSGGHGLVIPGLLYHDGGPSDAEAFT
jgi:hypothetical protein